MPVDDTNDQHCVITGCIARKLLPKHTYTGQPVGSEQMYELTLPYARVMATRLKGRPLQVEHDDGAIGEILHSWVNEKNEWYIKALIDRNSRSGNDIIKSMLQDEGSPVPMQIAELSLTHQGMQPYEVSMVMRGARDGSTVEQVELVDTEGLNAIKNLDYKVDIQESQEQFPSDTPVIMASFTALRNPTPATTYASLANAPSEAIPILKGVDQMRQQMHQMQQQQQQQQQPAAAAAGGAPEDDEATLMKKLQALQSRRSVAQTPQEAQFSRLTDKLSQPGIAGDPNNSGNVHTLHENPEDDQLMRVAGLFENKKNVFSRDELEGGKGMLMDIAQKTRANREAMAAKDAENAALAKKNAELQAQLNHHENDIEKQRKQTASLLKKLMIKTNPKATESEEKELDAFETNYVAGNKDAVQGLNPFLVRASAMLDAAANFSGDADMDSGESSSTPNFMHALQQALNPNQPLVKASGMNKRRYDNISSSAAAAASPSIWQKSGVHPSLAAMFQKVESNGVEDTITMGQLNASKYNRY